MRTKTVAKQARRRHRRVWVRCGVLAFSAFLLWSVSGRVAADTPGSPSCTVHTEAGTVEYLVGDACPPAGFAETMGYEPVLAQTSYGWRFEKPAWAGGNCSGPLADRGPFWDFGAACRTHDYGYDLVRFGAGTSRTEADALLYRDMMASCRERSGTNIPECEVLARWAHGVLQVGDAVGMDPEPGDNQ